MEHTEKQLGIHNSSFFDNFGQVLIKFPDIDLKDLFSIGQMESKRWLVNELQKLNLPLGLTYMCAGWYGSLAVFLLESGLIIHKIRSFDIDPDCAPVADTFNRSFVMDEWMFKASTMDILDMTYPNVYYTHRSDGSTVKLSEMPNTIINTSCEHIKNFDRWYKQIPSGTLVVLQSNNYYEIEEHVNCVEDQEELDFLTPMSDTLYLGTLTLEKYNRYMKIGYK